MRIDSPELGPVLRDQGLLRHWVADLYYGTERRAVDVPLVDPELQWSDDDQVQGRGKVTVAWQGQFADSIVPRTAGDMYAPFGATLNIREVIEAGTARWEIPLGWFPIVDVPAARDQKMRWQGRSITVGSRVELVLMDRMAELEPDFFDTPTAPTDHQSALAEVARLTRLQIVRNIADAGIPRTVVYEENRLDALYELCDVALDAVPYMTTDGAMAFRPNEWPEPVAELVYGPGGTVQSIGDAMSAEGVHNYVVVRSQSTDAPTVLWRGWVTDGPLRVHDSPGVYAPARARKLALSSQYVTTGAQAREWGERELRNASRLAAKNVELVLGHDSRFEVGDVVTLRDTYENTTVRCRFTQISLRTKSATMTARVEVAR